MRGTLVIALSAVLAFNGISYQVNAEKIPEVAEDSEYVKENESVENDEYVEDTADETEVSDINVEITASISFTEEEKEAYAASIQAALDENVEQIENELLTTSNGSKTELLENMRDAIGDVDVNAIFEESEDGYYEIEVPVSGITLDVAGVEVETDEDGEALAENVSVGTDEFLEDAVELADANDDVDYDISVEDDTVSCDIKMSFADFSQGVEEMSDNMSDSKAQACKFYAKRKVRSTFGHGAGQSLVYFDKNIVGCNKCDTSETHNYTTMEFALGNSDCSKSVKLGLVALACAGTDPATFATYSYSIFCVQEGMTNVISTDKETNAYCNGKKKTGGHVNCSWFTGIGHSEQFHTHY